MAWSFSVSPFAASDSTGSAAHTNAKHAWAFKKNIDAVVEAEIVSHALLGSSCRHSENELRVKVKQKTHAPSLCTAMCHL